MGIVFSPEYSRQPDASLEKILERNEAELTFYAHHGKPLTLDRLKARQPHLTLSITPEMVSDLGWPTAMSAVESIHSIKSKRFLTGLPEEADQQFTLEAMHDLHRSGDMRGFNNFPAIIGSRPVDPRGIEPGDLWRNGQELHWGTKPYLHRANLVAPDFMEALRRQVAGQSGWMKSVIDGGVDPATHPREAVLLRASRLAYGLLQNLMDRDDLRRQAEWLGLKSHVGPITDPDHELWT